MPQPIKRKLKHLELHGEHLLAKSELASRIGVLTAEWSKAEMLISLVFAATTEVPLTVAVDCLSSVVNFKARVDVVMAAVQFIQDEKTKSNAVSCLEQLKKRSDERNRVAHGIWGWSEDHPNKLIRIDPHDAIGIVAISQEAGELGHVIENLTDKCELWSESCFKDVTKRIRSASTLTLKIVQEIAALKDDQDQ